MFISVKNYFVLIFAVLMKPIKSLTKVYHTVVFILYIHIILYLAFCAFGLCNKVEFLIVFPCIVLLYKLLFFGNRIILTFSNQYCYHK